ncbi:MAG TPA: hypothetical protein VGM67_14235 [Gemmatimonadaceae bacterium]|jgi:hypothetical protein
MNDPVTFLPTTDPLLRHPRLEYTVSLPVLGLPARFESNSQQVIDVVERAFGQWRTVDAPDDATDPFRIRIVVHDGPEDSERPVRVRYIAPDANRIIAQSSGSIAISDPERRESVAYVSATAVEDREHFQSAFLEATTLALLAHFDRHPVHASAVALDGRAVLLAGPSGAGKSTLAHLAHEAGIDVMSEDRVWVQLDPTLRIWGWPGHARLRFAGESAKRIVSLARSDGANCHRADAAVVCVLARGSAASLDRIDSGTVCAALTHDVAPGFDRFPSRHNTCARTLAAPGGWRLTLSSDPRDALPLLQRMLRETPSRAAQT